MCSNKRADWWLVQYGPYINSHSWADMFSFIIGRCCPQYASMRAALWHSILVMLMLMRMCMDLVDVIARATRCVHVAANGLPRL